MRATQVSMSDAPGLPNRRIHAGIAAFCDARRICTGPRRCCRGHARLIDGSSRSSPLTPDRHARVATGFASISAMGGPGRRRIQPRNRIGRKLYPRSRKRGARDYLVSKPCTTDCPAPGWQLRLVHSWRTTAAVGRGRLQRWRARHIWRRFGPAAGRCPSVLETEILPPGGCRRVPGKYQSAEAIQCAGGLRHAFLRPLPRRPGDGERYERLGRLLECGDWVGPGAGYAHVGFHRGALRARLHPGKRHAIHADSSGVALLRAFT